MFQLNSKKDLTQNARMERTSLIARGKGSTHQSGPPSDAHFHHGKFQTPKEFM